MDEIMVMLGFYWFKSYN